MSTRNSFGVRALVVTALALAGVAAGGFTFILNDSTGLPVKWIPGSVPLRIMLGTTQNLTDGNSLNGSAAEAAAIWNVQLGAMQFTSTQVAPGSASQSNNLNELAFASDVFGQKFDDSVLAVTTGFSRGNQRRPSDIIFNTAYTWGSYRGARTGDLVDLRRVAIHELGHLLGLDHPDEGGQSVVAIMNSKIGFLDTLADDDIQGGQGLYGPPGVPANNNFASATLINFNGGQLTLKGYNTNATKEPGEPNHADNSGGRSVWWRWTPAATGDVTIDTKGSYSDTTLAIYTGSALAALTSVASDDDITDGVIQASTVTFHVTANTTYQIAVDGFNGDDGDGADCSGLTLNFNFAAANGLAPTITTQPNPVTVDVGGSASFTVTVTGSSPFSFQWRFNQADISGATSASYSLTNIQSSQAGSYSVVVTNPIGTATSSGASLVVRAASGGTGGGGGSGGGGGGGGGGAPSLWFCAMLAALGLGRLRQRRRR